MPRLRLCLPLMLAAVVLLRAATTPSAPPAPVATAWDRITVPPLKTSIYVGSVTLTTDALVRSGSTLSSTYEAKVRPWFFWGETGSISITLSDTALASLARGERTEFTGDATNHKKKPRKVTGYAEPADATSGKIKVRIMADGIELIFNGPYKLEAAPK